MQCETAILFALKDFKIQDKDTRAKGSMGCIKLASATGEDLMV